MANRPLDALEQELQASPERVDPATGRAFTVVELRPNWKIRWADEDQVRIGPPYSLLKRSVPASGTLFAPVTSPQTPPTTIDAKKAPENP